MISALSPYSYYQTYFFPKKMIEYLDPLHLSNLKYCLNGKRSFFFLVKKITYVCEGKQLVLKNPAHTVRIKHLIRMFPHAKFIYMHGDPDEVLKSTKKLFDKFLELYSFQEMKERELQANVHGCTCKCCLNMLNKRSILRSTIWWRLIMPVL